MSAQLPSDVKRDLVAKAERIATKVEDKRGQVAQLRNMIHITQTEGEVAVLANFIRYQAGRKATSDFWQPIETEVIAALEEIGRLAEAIRHRAIQHFFGYLVRHYVYLTRQGAPPAGGASPPSRGGADRRRP